MHSLKSFFFLSLLLLCGAVSSAAHSEDESISLDERVRLRVEKAKLDGLEGWKKMIPEGTKDARPWIVAADLCCDLAKSEAAVDLEIAQCIAVQFDSYVRPSAAVDLKILNIVAPGGAIPSGYDQV